jgi:hypothetical protein
MSKETIEQAAENYVNKFYTTYAFKEVLKSLFIDGVQWHEQNSKKEGVYSEEDMLKAFEAGMMFIGQDKGSFKELIKRLNK